MSHCSLHLPLHRWRQFVFSPSISFYVAIGYYMQQHLKLNEYLKKLIRRMVAFYSYPTNKLCIQVKPTKISHLILHSHLMWQCCIRLHSTHLGFKKVHHQAVHDLQICLYLAQVIPKDLVGFCIGEGSQDKLEVCC